MTTRARSAESFWVVEYSHDMGPWRSFPVRYSSEESAVLTRDGMRSQPHPGTVYRVMAVEEELIITRTEVP